MAEKEGLARVFAALANNDRLALINELARATSQGADRAATISYLADHADLPRLSASRHLRILRDSGLIEARQDGRRVLHQFRSDELNAIDDWLYPLLASSTLDAMTGT